MALSHLLDTSVLIGEPPELNLDSSALLVTSIVCLGELHAGVLLAQTPAARARRLQRLTAVASTTIALDVDHMVAAAYGRLRAESGRAPSNDLWIAATAAAHGLVLVTRDGPQAQLPGLATLLV